MRIVVAIACLVAHGPVAAGELRVAVASNFVASLESIAEAFHADAGHEIVVISGSTGKLYAQIVNGAPFDVFLAADAERPRRLEAAGLAVPGSRFTYAVGQLVLWARDTRGSGEACIDALLADERPRLSIANPATAPYGRAAEQYLREAGLWHADGRRVIGENIAQALQFVSAGGADYGFIALAQRASLPDDACLWPVPPALYEPIRQQAVLLSRAADKPSAIAFLDYLKRDATGLIRDAGYRLEEHASE